MTEAESTRRVVDGHGIRLVTAGSGPPLVYLHGLGDTGALLPVLADLARTGTRTVIRPDHPGFLDSDPFAGDSVRELAAVHIALLNDLALGPVDLVGCSFGGWVAAEVALSAPGSVRTLTLIDPAGLPGDGSAPNAFSTDPALMLDLTVHDPDRRAALRATPPDERVARGLARSHATARRLAEDPYMCDPTLAARLAALRMPVQLFWGAEDGVIPVGYALGWQRALPADTRVEIIDEAGHLPHVERPDEFLARFAPVAV